MDPLVTPVVIGGLGAVIWWAVTKQKPFNKLMRTLDLKNKEGKFPYQLDHDIGHRTETYVIEVPDGIPYEVFSDPKSKIFQAVRQSIGDMHRLEVVPVDGHKLAIRVILEELGTRYDYVPIPPDKSNPMVFPMGESLDGPVTLKIGDSNPHMCEAGTTGSGKSCLMEIMAAHLILHPRRTDICIIDLKGGTQFQSYMKCERVIKYARDISQGIGILSWLQHEMIERNNKFFAAEVKCLDEYNKKHPEDKMRRIVLFVDEFAELAKDKAAQPLLADLLRRARSSGIHAIVATQHPTTEIINSQIKANMTSYCCFAVVSTSNSVTVLGHGGAELLQNPGRYILRAPGHRKPIEVQSYYIREDECVNLVRHTYVEKPAKGPNTEGVYRG